MTDTITEAALPTADSINPQTRAMLLKIAASIFKVKPEDLKDETRLREDLDFDSIDLFDLLSHVTKETSIEVETEQFRSVKTFGDLAIAVDLALKSKDTVKQ